MFLLVIQFKMDSICQEQVPPILRPKTAPIGRGDSNSEKTAKILDNASEESQEIELQKLSPQKSESEMSESARMMQINEPLLTQQPHLAAAVPDGYHSGLEQGSKLDKGQASSFIDQCIADLKIQTSVICPMDRVIIAQTLHNPHPDYQEEIITVQIVYQNLQIDDGTIQKDLWPQSLTKLFKHPLEMHDSHQSEFKYCKLCAFKIQTEEKHYNCKEIACLEVNNKEDFFEVRPCTCCAKCMLKSEVRSQLEEKTMLQNLVQLYHLDEIDAQQEQTDQKLNLNEGKVDHNIISVQKMPIQRDTKDPDPETISQKQKHAIIGLWRKNNSGYNECYRQFRIDHPVTEKQYLGRQKGWTTDIEDFKLETLFYVGDKGGLYYFTQTKTLNHLGAKKKEFYLQQFDLARACRIKIDSIKLRPYHRNLYFPPIIGEKQAVGNVVDNLLQSVFFQPKDDTDLREYKITGSPYRPQFFERAGYLALTVKKAARLNDFSSKNLVDTEDNNIFFCRLDQPSKIDKVIYNGCVALKVRVTSDKITEVWYSCDKNLTQISWKNEINQILQEQSTEYKIASCYAYSGKTDEEDKEIQRCLEYRGTQVQGVMHNNDQRVSFVYRNCDYMTFEINKETNKAVLLWGNKFQRAQFCFSNDGSLFICFNLFHEEAQEKDFNSIKLDCRNLDAEKTDQSSNEVEYGYSKEDFKIEFKIGKNFQIDNKFYTEKEIDRQTLVYQFTDFRTQIKNGKQEFMVYLHFVDTDTYQPNLYFLKGQKIGLGDNEECVNQTFVRKQATIEYPILIQSTDLPLQNQLLVANLSLNEPQKMIDLGSHRFICFVETGLQSERTILKAMKIGIFFLALSQNGQIKLMKFQTNPWLTRKRDTNVIKIFSGFILVEKITQPTKIKGAALLFHSLGSKNLLMKIVIQFQEDIKVYSLTDPEYLIQLNLIQNQLEERTAKIHMVCNKNMIFYVKRFGTTEYKIICVHHQGLEIKTEVAYTSSFEILQLQSKQDAVPTENEQSLYIIDSQSRFIEIKCNIKDLTFECVSTQQMNKAEQIIHKLKSQEWQKVALSSRSVTASFIQGDTKSSNCNRRKILKSAVTYNLTTGSIFYHDFLGYKVDLDIHYLGHWVNNHFRETNRQVFSVQHLSGIGKILLTVQEGNFCYYLLMQSIDSRRIDLFSHQPNNDCWFIPEMKLHGNLIIAQQDSKAIFFEQNSLMQKQTTQNNFDYDIRGWGVHDCKIQSNYLLKKITAVDWENGKFLKGSFIIRSNPFGRFTTIFFNLQNYISEQRTAIDYQLKAEFKGQAGEEERCRETNPRRDNFFFVTSKGTLVLSFHLAQSNEENKKVQNEVCSFQIVKFNLPYKNEDLETINQGINDLTEDESKVIIYVIKNDTLKTNDLEFRQTEDFYVILGEDKIFFKKLALINETVTKQEGHSVDKIGEFNNFKGIKTFIESNECCYQFECIDLSQLFTEKVQQDSYKLIVMSGKQPDNVIHIFFKDIVVSWDLEKNQELSQITNFDQFSTPETMIPSPFQFQIPRDDKFVKEAFAIEQTNDKNTFLWAGPTKITCLFKMYTMLDLIEMQAIHLSLELQGGFKNSTPIDLESVLAFFHGKNFFQLFRKNPEVIQSFLTQLKEKKLQKFVNEHGLESDNIYVRRLFRTLKAQTTAEDENQESLIFKRYQQKNFEQPKLSGLNIFQEQLKSDSDLLLLKILVEILLFSSEVDISTMITDFEHFKKVINIQSDWVSAFMKKVFKTNAQMEEVYNMPWDEKNQIVVFSANSSQLSSEEIKKQALVQMRTQTTVSYWYSRLIELINRNKKCKKLEPPTLKLKLVPVKVKMIEISWLSREALKDFYLFVSCSKNETFYDMELIRVLLMSQDYSMQLFYRAFFPYMILMGAMLYYFSVCVNDPHTEGFFGGEAVGLRCFIFAYQLFFLGVEVKQMQNQKGYYWMDPWNFVYLLQYALNFFVIIEHSTSWFGLDHSQLTQFTACITIFLWTILFYWMRIFDGLGFYVYLIIETLKDMKSFLILVLIVLITFANALYILEIANNTKSAVSEDTALTLEEDGASEIERLVKIAYNVTFIDSVVNQYLLGLGEFQYDEFSSSPSGPLIWSLFLLSTFLIQVTFMNMLIAIMSNTFSRVLKSQERYSLQQKTEITADFIYALSLSEMITESHYLYIIEPANTSESQDANLGAQREEMSAKVDALREELSAKVDALREELSAKVDALREELSAKVDAQAKQMTSYSRFTTKTNQLEVELNTDFCLASCQVSLLFAFLSV